MIGILTGFSWQGLNPTIVPLVNPGFTWSYYFIHNLTTASLIVSIGTLTYNLGSSLLLFLNGLSIGIGLHLAASSSNWATIWRQLLPHAIFEIPAIILSTILPYMVWQLRLQTVRRNLGWKKVIKSELLPSSIIILCLLLIAALIEGA